MAEWVRVDDAKSERWHRLTGKVLDDGKLEAACGMRVPVEAATDRRPMAPSIVLEHPACRER